MEWICDKCGVAMEEVDDIAINFKDMSLPEAEGLRCPQCGIQFLLSEYVIDQLAPAEAMMSGK